MKRRRRFHIQTRHLFLVLLIVCVFMIATTSYNTIMTHSIRSGFGTVMMPFQRGMNRLGGLVYEKIGSIRKLYGVMEENEKLLEEIGELRKENTRYQLQLSELATYKDLLKITDEYPDYDMVGAHIISKNSGNWFSTFKIDKGSNDGFSAGMNILADGGLVGIITSVEAHTSTVTSIIDDGRNVAAMAATSGAPCMVTGNRLLLQEGKLDVTHINKDDDIDTSYKIVTSNTSSEYLPGLLIGYISEIDKDTNNLTKTGKLVPVVDFSRLDTVMVITTLKQTEG
ncbi:MAG: rod shape-determining protein MreC [Lachnospiraceae bacterium]|nr:rod shape-determining protein MreC [Lachnospiraceae bacterium]